MIYDSYKYEDVGVKLEFSFKKGDENTAQKVRFIKLLEQAIDELRQELRDND